MNSKLTYALCCALAGAAVLGIYRSKKNSDRVKLYAFYTPSHQEFKDEWFIPSIQDDYELILERFDQECPTGTIMQAGWNNIMVHKLDMILRGIKENWGKVFVHSDVDIQFFGKTKNVLMKAMEGKDLVIQRDDPYGEVCAGFFACRGNDRTLKLFEQIKRKVLEPGNRHHDQDWLNEFIYRSNPFNVTWDYLPREMFMGGGTYTAQLWLPGRNLPVPDTLLMHHANYTKGPQNKFAQLNYVKGKREQRSTV